MSNHIISDQRGPPPDPRQAISRAHQQPRAGVTDVTRGSYQQPRTGMIHATRGKTISRKTFNICTYNPRTINDLKNHSLDTMLHELINIKWDIVGFSKTKVKESKIKIHETIGRKLFRSSSNETSRSNGVGFLINKTCLPLIEDY